MLLFDLADNFLTDFFYFGQFDAWQLTGEMNFSLTFARVDF